MESDGDRKPAFAELIALEHTLSANRAWSDGTGPVITCRRLEEQSFTSPIPPRRLVNRGGPSGP